MAHPDLDDLLNALYSFAQEMLAKHGEFYPFGACITVDGEIAHVGGYPGNEHSPSQEVIDLVLAGLRDKASKGEIWAGGICLDVRVVPPGSEEKTDAICFRLEHSNSEAVEVFMPYKKGWFGKVKHGDIFTGPGEAAIFPHGGKASQNG